MWILSISVCDSVEQISQTLDLITCEIVIGAWNHENIGLYSKI